MISAIQIAILVAAIVVGRATITVRVLQISFVVMGATLVCHLINPAVDLKILFDLGLIPAFFLLGTTSSSARAQRLVEMLLVIVVVFGVLEMLLPDLFGRIFNVLQYYIDKGVVGPNDPTHISGNFLFNGERPEDVGRTLLPMIFSAHRAGSIFLESISAGNFPIICLGWLLSTKESNGWRRRGALLLVGFCVILPDSRFAAIACVLIVIVAFLGGHRIGRIASLFFPAVLLALWVLGGLDLQPGEVPRIITDDFAGRLSFSGRLLAYWDWRNWLALAPSSVVMWDNGYGYVINNIGIATALGIWLCLAAQRICTPQGLAMRASLSVYVSGALCIGQSVFSIKTAALAWFLYGAAQVVKDDRRTIGYHPASR